MPKLVIRGGSLAFSRGGLIFIPELVLQGSLLAFFRGGHFELLSALLSSYARAQMLVIGLGWIMRTQLGLSLSPNKC